MGKCTDCIHHFVCETLTGKLEDTWAETCVAYNHKENILAPKLRMENKQLHIQLETIKQDRDYYRDAYHHLLMERKDES